MKRNFKSKKIFPKDTITIDVNPKTHNRPHYERAKHNLTKERALQQKKMGLI